jgi:hypothetical protein
MIINENGWGDKPQEEVKESIKAKKIKKHSEDAAVETAGEEDAEQE